VDNTALASDALQIVERLGGKLVSDAKSSFTHMVAEKVRACFNGPVKTTNAYG
jgi:hypothetical protein